MAFLGWIGALAIGLTLGLLGSGGSIVTVPVLVYVLGEPEKVAIAESLAIVSGISLLAALPYAVRGRVDPRSVLFFGLPGMAGTWLGALSPNATMAVLFPGIGAGAIFEVIYEIAKLLQRDTEKQPTPMLVFGGVLAGMLLLWVTGLLVK